MPIPESGGSSSSAGPASTSSFGPHGGIRALETLVGPGAVSDATSQDQHPGRLQWIIETINDIIVLVMYE